MRIRQVRPEFWSDETLAALPDAARLFYIGLWNISDDAGWLEWRPSHIGALLYPFRQVARRERDISGWSRLLSEDGRLKIYECGCAEIPTLPRHQRVAGKPAYSVRDRHFGRHLLLSVRTDSHVEVSRVEGSREGMATTSDFKEKLAKAGYRES
jgi:hypothetical protein